MSNNIFRGTSQIAALVACVFVFGVLPSPASNTPRFSGSYNVEQETDLGARSRVRMRIHLVNHGPSSLSVRRMMLWDYSHPENGGTRACSIALNGHAATDTTQEFTISRADYESWQKGMRPRLVLELAGPGRCRTKAMVRLTRTSRQEMK